MAVEFPDSIDLQNTRLFNAQNLTDGNGDPIGAFSGRELLTTSTTWYVNETLGSDSNDGLSTGAGAFQTLQKAVDVAGSTDTGDPTLNHTIQIETNLTISSQVDLPCLIGSAPVNIIGDQVTPSNITLTGPGFGVCFRHNNICRWGIFGIRINNFDTGINTTNGSTVTGDLRFTNIGTRAYVVSNYGEELVTGDIFVEYSGSNLVFADRFGRFEFQQDIEFGPTSTFSVAIFYARYQSSGRVVNATFSGTTGSGLGNSIRTDNFSVIDTASGSAVGLPGNGTHVNNGGVIV